MDKRNKIKGMRNSSFRDMQKIKNILKLVKGEPRNREVEVSKVQKGNKYLREELNPTKISRVQ